MTYCLNRKSRISRASSWLLHLLGRVVPFITGPVVMKWSVTQVRAWERGWGTNPGAELGGLGDVVLGAR
jgi:hypothetical protein